MMILLAICVQSFKAEYSSTLLGWFCSKVTNVIAVLGKVAKDTLDLTDMYYSGVPGLSKSAQYQRAANAST